MAIDHIAKAAQLRAETSTPAEASEVYGTPRRMQDMSPDQYRLSKAERAEESMREALRLLLGIEQSLLAEDDPRWTLSAHVSETARKVRGANEAVDMLRRTLRKEMVDTEAMPS